MKKAVFLGEQSNVDQVYSAETITSLTTVLEFPCGTKVFDKTELAYIDLKDISFVFSTWGMCELNETEIVRFLPKVEAVFYAAGSVQRFARPFLKKGIRVFSAWGANGAAVAEFTLAQIILAGKGYFNLIHTPGLPKEKEWYLRKREVSYTGNYDNTIGIIGAGMIGRLVIEKIHQVLEHTRILVFDPFMSQEKADMLGVELCDLKKLFSESDVISNHLANNAQTVGILNGQLFDCMKPWAVFINTGRGAQVVEADLIQALKNVPSRAALLDVTFPEPASEDSELYQMKNVFLSPHIAGSLGNEVRRMGEYMLDEYSRYANGLSLRYEVTIEMLETMA